jgi:hypothetical protein
MNRKILICILIFIISNSKLECQKLSFGCKTGFDLSQFIKETITDSPSATLKESFQLRPSFELGFVLNYQLFKKLQIQLEPGYIEKGTQIKDDVHNFWDLNRIGYLSAPLTIIVTPIKRFNLEGGLEFNKLIYLQNMDRFATSMKYYNKSEISVFGGASFKASDKIYFNIRYSQALTRFLQTHLYADPYPGTNYTFNYFNKYYSIGVRYYFSKKIKFTEPISKKSNCHSPEPQKQ